MSFRDPQLLAWLLLAPVLGLVLAWGHRRRARRLAAYAEPALLARLAPADDRRRQSLRAAVFLLGAAAVAAALAGPQWGFATRRVRTQGADVVIALDVSQSMATPDVPPDRLTKAKREIADVLAALPGDRVALVAFAGEAYLQCPLTMDAAAVKLFLDSIDTSLVPRQGTSLRQALETARQALRRGAENEDPRAGAILVVSDAEDFDADPSPILQELAKEGIRVYAYVVGTETGAPVPDPGGGLKRDVAGSPVVSRARPDALIRAARATGGEAWGATAQPGELARHVATELRPRLGVNDGVEREERLPILRVSWLLAPAFVLLWLGAWIDPWGGRRRARRDARNPVTSRA